MNAGFIAGLNADRSYAPQGVDRNLRAHRAARLMFERLEDRVLFSAVTVESVTDVFDGDTSSIADVIASPGVQVNADTTTEQRSDVSSTSDAASRSASEIIISYATLPQRQEIVFVDTSVEDYQTLIEGVDPGAEVFLLDSTRDGIEQIAEVIKGRSGIDAIHIVSHGDAGKLRLGTGRLTLGSMAGEYTDELASISQALTNGADLLIYGCNFGEGQPGQTAATRLAQLTGTDVAASTDLTGSAPLGGDWDLEFSTGQIETAVAFTLEAQQAWLGVLVDGDTTVGFQEGVNGYTGTQDTYLDENFPTTSQGSATTLQVDLDDGGGAEQHTLIKFDNLFGAGVGQIPLGSTIISASLTLDVSDISVSSATVSLHRMLSTWDETSTWNLMTNGIQTDDVEASSTVDGTVVNAGTLGAVTVTGLETSLQAWSDGATNEGWAIKSDSIDDWEINSSENVTSSLRPKLTVEYQTTGGDITTGLVGLWDLDANANDASGNGYNGTLTGGASIDTTDITDQMGAGKLSLDGAG